MPYLTTIHGIDISFRPKPQPRFEFSTDFAGQPSTIFANWLSEDTSAARFLREGWLIGAPHNLNVPVPKLQEALDFCKAYANLLA